MDIAYQLRKAHEDLGSFQRKIKAKQKEREKVVKEIEADEKRVRAMKMIERDIALKKSKLARIDQEIKRFSIQKTRLMREVPSFELELKMMQMERRFGKKEKK